MRIHKLKKFADSRGWSLNDIFECAPPPKIKPLDITLVGDVNYSDFQVNYSLLYPGIVKAWHRHKYQDDYFCVVKGMAQVGVYTEEDGAEKYFVGEHNPVIVHIKAGEWHGLTAVGNEPVGLLYFVTKRYNESEPDEERANPYDFVEPEWWKPENK